MNEIKCVDTKAKKMSAIVFPTDTEAEKMKDICSKRMQLKLWNVIFIL